MVTCVFARIVYTLCLSNGFYLLFLYWVNSVEDIPVFGQLFSQIIAQAFSLLALYLAILFALFTKGCAWARYKPLIGIGLIALVFAILYISYVIAEAEASKAAEAANQAAESAADAAADAAGQRAEKMA